MQVSEEFSKVLRVVLAAFGLMLAGFLVSDMQSPRHEVSAQNAGVVGIQASMVPLWISQGTTAGVTSGGPGRTYFQDFGQGATYVLYCNSSFIGEIDIRTVTTTGPVVLAQATYQTGNADNSCHVLQFGGYFSNSQAHVTITSGNQSAWYSSSSAPIPYVPTGLGSNGATAPPVCDQSQQITATTGGTTSFAITPTNVGNTLVICGFSVSFNGATSGGTISLGWASSTACSSVSASWTEFTTASTPQLFTVTNAQRSPIITRQDPCFSNNSGASADVSIMYASVQL